MLSLLSLAIAPVALALIYIYSRDLIAKEPSKALAKAFFSGATIPIIGVIILVSILRVFIGDPDSFENSYWAAFDSAVIEAAIPEEAFKFFILYWLVWNSKQFDENFDGIVYAVFVSMGFACSENIMYVLENGAATGYIRAFTAIPGHFCFAVIMGYYFSIAKFDSSQREICLAKSLLFPIIAHGIYDYIIFLCMYLKDRVGDEADEIIGFAVLFFFLFIFKLWKQAHNRIKEMRKRDEEALKKAKAIDEAQNDLNDLPRRRFSRDIRNDPKLQDLFDD